MEIQEVGQVVRGLVSGRSSSGTTSLWLGDQPPSVSPCENGARLAVSGEKSDDMRVCPAQHTAGTGAGTPWRGCSWGSRAHLFSTDRMAVQAFFSLWTSRESVLNRASVKSSS